MIAKPPESARPPALERAEDKGPNCNAQRLKPEERASARSVWHLAAIGALQRITIEPVRPRLRNIALGSRTSKRHRAQNRIGEPLWALPYLGIKAADEAVPPICLAGGMVAFSVRHSCMAEAAVCQDAVVGRKRFATGAEGSVWQTVRPHGFERLFGQQFPASARSWRPASRYASDMYLHLCKGVRKHAAELIAAARVGRDGRQGVSG